MRGPWNGLRRGAKAASPTGITASGRDPDLRLQNVNYRQGEFDSGGVNA